jgi:hypothetical protein
MMSSKYAKRMIIAAVVALPVLFVTGVASNVTGGSTGPTTQHLLTITSRIAYADEGCDGVRPPPGIDCPPTPTPTPVPIR